jgi:4-aminobutyrate--pyruvate transaminase
LAAELDEVILREGPDTFGAFFAEPVLGAGGVIPPPVGYFQAISKVLKRHGIPLISDEVICGFGRTGEAWGCETYDFMPDAIISSKNLTAGYFPMGAVILGPELTDRMQNAIDEIEEFPHGFTASGHPVGCAIALKSIDLILNGGLMQQVRDGAPRMQAGLAEIAKHTNIGELRGVGYMWALEAVRDKDTKTPFEGHLSVSERIANTCTDHGLICRPLGQSIVLCPPFILSDAEMDEMFEKLQAALNKVFAELA